MYGHASVYFLLRLVLKASRQNSDVMSEGGQTTGNVRTSIARTASDRWILAVEDENSHKDHYDSACGPSCANTNSLHPRPPVRFSVRRTNPRPPQKAITCSGVATS